MIPADLPPLHICHALPPYLTSYTPMTHVRGAPARRAPQPAAMAPHAFQSQPCQPSIIRSIPSLSFRQLAAFPLMHSWSACLLCAPDVDPTLTTFPDLALRCRLMRSLVRRSTALRRRREVSLAAAGAAARCGGGGGGAGGAGGGGGGCDASDFGTCNAAFASTRRSRHCTRLYTSRSASDRVRSCRGEL